MTHYKTQYTTHVAQELGFVDTRTSAKIRTKFTLSTDGVLTLFGGASALAAYNELELLRKIIKSRQNAPTVLKGKEQFTVEYPILDRK